MLCEIPKHKIDKSQAAGIEMKRASRGSIMPSLPPGIVTHSLNNPVMEVLRVFILSTMQMRKMKLREVVTCLSLCG